MPAAEPSAEIHAFRVPKDGPYQAQHGEDRWLEAFFGGKADGVFVEVGAYDGVVLSNTYFFESIGWTGVLVEPDAAKAARCRSSRPKSQIFECAAVGSGDVDAISFYEVAGGQVYSTVNMTDEHRKRLDQYGLSFTETRVKAMTLDRILEAAKLSRIDFVTIDVEEGELEVLRGFDLSRWRPEAVMVETNSRFRSAEIRRYFVERGYVFHYSIVNNDIYVPLRRHQRLASVVDTTSYVLHRAMKSLRFRLNALRSKRRPS
jgi:FkbM family methyltransferase